MKRNVWPASSTRIRTPPESKERIVIDNIAAVLGAFVLLFALLLVGLAALLVILITKILSFGALHEEAGGNISVMPARDAGLRRYQA